MRKTIATIMCVVAVWAGMCVMPAQSAEFLWDDFESGIGNWNAGGRYVDNIFLETESAGQGAQAMRIDYVPDAAGWGNVTMTTDAVNLSVLPYLTFWAKGPKGAGLHLVAVNDIGTTGTASRMRPTFRLNNEWEFFQIPIESFVQEDWWWGQTGPVDWTQVRTFLIEAAYLDTPFTLWIDDIKFTDQFIVSQDDVLIDDYEVGIGGWIGHGRYANNVFLETGDAPQGAQALRFRMDPDADTWGHVHYQFAPLDLSALSHMRLWAKGPAGKSFKVIVKNDGEWDRTYASGYDISLTQDNVWEQFTVPMASFVQHTGWWGLDGPVDWSSVTGFWYEANDQGTLADYYVDSPEFIFIFDIMSIDPPANSRIAYQEEPLDSIAITFSDDIRDIAADFLLVNGEPATDLTGEGAGPYVFSGWPAPTGGETLTVELEDGLIESDGGFFLDGRSWTYTMVERISIEAYRTDTPIIIDGVIEDTWPNAATFFVEDNVGAVPVEENNADLYIMHDDTYVYIAAHVEDDEILPTNVDVPWYQNDCIEIFFDGDGVREILGWQGINDSPTGGQYATTWDGSDHGDLFLPNGANNETFGPNDEDWFAATSQVDANHWVFEMRIKKSAIGNPLDGEKVGFDMQLQDHDSEGRVGSVWFCNMLATDQAWNDERTWGDLWLLDAPISEATPTPTPVEPTPAVTPVPTPTGPIFDDADADGKPDECETEYTSENPGWTHIWLPDSDGDGLLDGEENIGGCDPLILVGSLYMTNPLEKDTDGDGLWDGIEVLMGTDPLDPADPGAFTDEDNDGLPDSVDPDATTSDADGDGFTDQYEFAIGTDPADGNSTPPLGDANADGSTNNLDAIMIFNWTLGNLETLPDMGVADVQIDALVNNTDAIVLFNWTLGNVPLLPLG